MRRDFQPVRGADQISTDLRLLTSHRTDLFYDTVRLINRLRALLREYLPALEATFDYSKKGPSVLLSGFHSADAIRRMGEARLATSLRRRGCRNSSQMAVKAVAAAHAQDTVLRTKPTGAALVARLAGKVIAVDLEIGEIDAMITERFSAHRDAEILTSMPGFALDAGGDALGQHG